jgi:hypothetical protein
MEGCCPPFLRGDVKEALTKWEPDQLEMGERLREYGQRLGDRSQFGP